MSDCQIVSEPLTFGEHKTQTAEDLRQVARILEEMAAEVEAGNIRGARRTVGAARSEGEGMRGHCWRGARTG